MLLGFLEGVRLTARSLDPVCVDLLRAVTDTAPVMQGGVVYVTSAQDGTHKAARRGQRGSFHAVARAFDFRFAGIRPGAIAITGAFSGSSTPAAEGLPSDYLARQREEAEAWALRIEQACPGWQVVVEPVAGDATTPPHLHAEYDPTG